MCLCVVTARQESELVCACTGSWASRSPPRVKCAYYNKLVNLGNFPCDVTRLFVPFSLDFGFVVVQETEEGGCNGDTESQGTAVQSSLLLKVSDIFFRVENYSCIHTHRTYVCMCTVHTLRTHTHTHTHNTQTTHTTHTHTTHTHTQHTHTHTPHTHNIHTQHNTLVYYDGVSIALSVLTRKTIVTLKVPLK